MLSPKKPRCTICGEKGHYKTFCFSAPKKRMVVKRPLQPAVYAYKRKAGLSSFSNKSMLRRSTLSSEGKSERSKLIREADRVFSIYIRAKDAINGRASCVTCGGSNCWKLLHNGHYLSRRIMATRWNQVNCNVQCEWCNVTLHGNLSKYKDYLEQKHGEGVHEYLKEKVRNSHKITNMEIQSIIDTYKTKILELKL